MHKTQGMIVLASVAAISFGVAAWLLVASPATEAPVGCEDTEPISSYDLTVTFTNTDSAVEAVYEVEGKVNRTTISGPDGIFIQVYDGEDTVYGKEPGYTLYEKITSSRFGEIQDVSAQEFPYGAESLCPDIDALGAKYEDTDEVGKRYRIDAEKYWDEFLLWTDEDGWLLRVEYAEMDIKLTFSGIGETNEIVIPDPPYWNETTMP